MNNEDIKRSHVFLDKLIGDQELMQSTINTEREGFIGSDDHDCYRCHEVSIMFMQAIKAQLKELMALRQQKNGE